MRNLVFGLMTQWKQNIFWDVETSWKQVVDLFKTPCLSFMWQMSKQHNVSVQSWLDDNLLKFTMCSVSSCALFGQFHWDIMQFLHKKK